MSPRSTTYDATYALVESLAAAGVGQFVISPGSRSTVLAICADLTDVDTVVVHDERAAAFLALGWTRATGVPSALICTSGTAAANYLPAMIEAAHSGLPLIALTADRPPEVRGFGAGQTIDQVKLYGTNVVWYHELPVMNECPPEHAHQVGQRAVFQALEAQRGPVHLNVPYREPFSPDPHWSPTRLEVLPKLTRNAASTDRARPSTLLADLATQSPRGLIVAGRGELSDDDAAAIRSLASSALWPIIAEPASTLWVGADATRVEGADLLLRIPPIATEMKPDVVLKVGGGLSSKTLRSWLGVSEPWRTILFKPGRDWNDPTHSMTDVIVDGIDDVAGAGPIRTESSWHTRWRELSETCASVISEARNDALNAQTAVEAICGSLSERDGLFVSNSLAVRDLDLFGGGAPPTVRIGVNRGASGIDGVTSSAIGFALGHRSHTTLLIGDLAYLHDFSGLIACSRLGVDLTIVVFDDNGGGIFSRLATAEMIEPDRFERLFTTPHDRDLLALSRGTGIESHPVESRDQLVLALREARDRGGIQILIATVDGETNRQHSAAIFDRLAQRLS